MNIPDFVNRVTIGGVATDVFSVSAQFGIGSPVATCSLVIPIPAAAQVVSGADVTVEWIEDGVDWPNPIFVGTVPPLEQSLTVDGSIGTLLCEDRAARRLTFPLEKDKAFTGGARVAPATVRSAALHVGPSTIAWYADTTGGGTTVNVTVTPTANSSFVWLAGRLHGTNSWDTDPGKAIKTWSRVEVRQAGELLGFAHFPESAEQWTDQLDYTNDANWEDFELFVAAPIVAADGDVTIRFVAGYKPGTTTRDDYEVKSVTWQTAGTNTLREIVRGLCKRCGLTPGQYDVPEIKATTGETIKLGGNGYVNAGQIVVAASEQPLAFINRLLGLFGYYGFACPDGPFRVRQVRGQPSGNSVATFTEGIDILGLPTVAGNPVPYNAVRVEGATGNTQFGTKFAYVYQTDPLDVAANPLIPSPPGIALYRAPGGQELTSFALCERSGKVAELESGDVTTLSMDVVPTWLRPGQAITVVSPTTGLADLFWVTDVRYDSDAEDGFRVSVDARQGGAVPFGEEADPDIDEVDVEPGDRRPALEWLAYWAIAGAA